MGLAGLIVIFALLVGALYFGAMRLGTTSDWVIRTHQVLRRLQTLETSVFAAENAQRGYLVSQDTAFLDAYSTQVEKVRAELDGVEEVLGGTRPEEILDLRTKCEARIQAMGERLDEARNSESMPRLNLVRSREMMRGIQDAIGKISDAENHVLEERTKRFERISRALMVAGVVFVLVAVILLALVIYLLLSQAKVRRSREEALHAARDAALDSVRAKTSFLANVSHEIRTPMNGILGMVNLMLDTKLTPQQRDFSHTIKRCAESLLSLMNDILDLSKMEAGKLVIREVDFVVTDVLDACVELFSENAWAKGLEVGAVVAPNVPVHVRGDAIRLRQVLVNLVGNAVKFTESGEVVVHVELAEQTPDHVLLSFCVRDTGMGIATEEQDGLFQPFQQGGMGARKAGGSGLGLSICRELVERMGGEINLLSHVGQGTVVSFTVRFLPPSKPHEEEIASGVSEGAVLIVDDHPVGREVLESMMANWSIPHVITTSVAEALRALDEPGPTIRLAIIEQTGSAELPLPSAMEALHTHPRMVRARVFLVCYPAHRPSPVTLVNHGIDGTLSKPLKRAEVYERLAEQFGDAMRHGEPAGRATERATTASTEFDFSTLKRPPRVLVVEDNTVNATVTASQLARIGITADSARDGKEALHALSGRDYDLVLMDCQMPVMDGYEATRQIRARKGILHQPKIIAVTAHAMHGEAERCLESGMDDYLSKPVDVQKLVEKIKMHLGITEVAALQKRAGQQPQPGIPSGRAKASPQWLDARQLQDCLPGDPSSDSAFIREALTELERQVSALGRAVESGEVEAVRGASHKLKGSTATMGMLVLAADASELEAQAKAGALPQDGGYAQLLDHWEATSQVVRKQFKL